MHRRALILSVLLALSGAGAALAQDHVTQITAQLRDQGFRDIEVRRTLLGRSRILAQGAEGTREIIVNPTTGEILRDLWQPADGEGARRVLTSDRDSDRDGGNDDDPGSDNSGSGNDDSDGGGGSDNAGSDDSGSDDSSGSSDDSDDSDNSGKGGDDDGRGDTSGKGSDDSSSGKGDGSDDDT